jgi:UDP-glucose 4-epimerase
MNILILGGNGFIGSHLVDKYLYEGHHVRVFDKYEEHYRKPINGVDYRFGDFGNSGALEDTLDNIDILYHLVWSSLPKTSNDDPTFDVQSNVIETINLLEKCVQKNIKKFIFISSGGTVYGNPDLLPVNELNQTNPECSYGISKLCVEKYILLFSKLYGLDYIIARPSNPYGARQNPNGVQGAISVFLGKIKDKKDIEIWGDGEIIRDYIYIDDLVDGLYKASMSVTAHKIFNFGSGRGNTLNDIVNIIREITGIKFNVCYTEKRIFDINKIYFDISRAKEELGWEPTVPLCIGIKNTWEFIKSI